MAGTTPAPNAIQEDMDERIAGSNSHFEERGYVVPTSRSKFSQILQIGGDKGSVFADADEKEVAARHGRKGVVEEVVQNGNDDGIVRSFGRDSSEDAITKGRVFPSLSLRSQL